MRRLLVGTADGLFAIDEATSDQRLPGRAISNLISDSSEGWLAILDRRFVVRSADAVEWHEVVEVETYEVASLAHDGERIWIGTFPSHVVCWDGEHLQRSEAFERVAGRETWFTPWGGPPETRSLAIAPDGVIFANVHVGGIPRSSAGGARSQPTEWQPTIEVRADVHQVLVHPENSSLVLAAAARGLGLSRDGGDSWSLHRDGVHGNYMSAVAVAGDVAFVTSSTGSSNSAQSAIYRFDTGEAGAFEKIHHGLPDWFSGNINTFCLATCEQSIAFGTHDGHVYAANLDDLQWELVGSGLPAVLTIQFEDSSR